MFQTIRKNIAGWIAPKEPPVVEPEAEPNDMADRLDELFVEEEAAIREMAKASESSAFRDKYHTVADHVERIRLRVAEEAKK
jgi:hypothetical protein